MQVRRVLPFPRLPADRRAGVGAGRQAIVLNMYTEPAFRRQGLARLLMYEVLAWARATELESLVLHAAPDGRWLARTHGERWAKYRACVFWLWSGGMRSETIC